MSFEFFESQAELVGKVAKVAPVFNTLNKLINSEVGSVLNDLAKDNLKEAHKSLDSSKNSKDYFSWKLELTSARDFFRNAKILFSNAAKKNKLIAIVAKVSEVICILYTAQCNEMLGNQKDRKENLEEAKKIYLWLMKPPIQDQLVPKFKILASRSNRLVIKTGVVVGVLSGLFLETLLPIPSGICTGVGALIGLATSSYIVLKAFPSSYVSREGYTQLENLIIKDDSEGEILKLINLLQTRIDKARKITSLFYLEGWVDPAMRVIGSRDV